MTTRTAACPPHQRLLALSALTLALLAPAAPASAEDFALECDVVAGILSLRLTGPARTDVRGRALDARTWVYEIADPSLKGLRPGPVSCVSAQSVRVLPGYMLGTRNSRIVITHAGGEPRAYSKGGRHRLTWLPATGPSSERAEARPEPMPAPELEPPRPSRDDVQRRRLEAEVAAQRDENARLRERLADDSPPPAPLPPPGPGKRELRQQQKAAKQAAREARKAEARAAKQARKQAPPIRRAEPARQPSVQATPPAAEPERERVIVGQTPRPSGPAPTPRALPPDYAAFPAASTLVATIPADLKDGPGRRYRTLRRLAAGERVSVTGRAGDWYRVGQGEGWAFATYLEASTAGGGLSSQLGVVQEVTVPVHEGPGGQHAVVAELYRGQQVVIDELKGEWAHVRNGGWVRRSALGDLKPGQGSSK